MGADHVARRTLVGELLLWAGAGLLAPSVLWTAARLGFDLPSPLGLAVILFYPTWWFGWCVMGLHSEAGAYAALGGTVLGNVALYVAVGTMSRRMRRFGRQGRWIATAGVYVLASGLITLVAYWLL